MKPTTVFLAIVGLLTVSAGLSVAYSRSKMGDALRSQEQFARLATGDRILYLCRQCDSRREVTLASVEDAAERFKAGAVIVCPGCNDKMHVVIDPPADASHPTQVRFVNENGHECMYVTKAPPRR
jgi:hypothetical protein